MILAFDTYYYAERAKTVCISFSCWEASKYTEVYIENIENNVNYVPGEFYKKELPCILSLLQKIDLQNVDFIIIDGFVFLDDNDKYGLGAHLYERLNSIIPVIGIAKTNYATLEHNKRQVLRGKSRNPLFITSIGIDLDHAVKKVRTLHGDNRIPTLLKELDRLTKER